MNNIDLEKYIKLYPNITNCINKRNNFKGIVISISGSCGKTTTTSMIYELLKSKYNVQKSHENSNGFLGICWCITDLYSINNDFWIQEIGISNVDEMIPKLNILKPSIYILTNIYEAHTSNFNKIEDYHDEKIKFIKNPPPNSIIIINNDNNIINSYIKNNILFYQTNNIKIIYCGLNLENDVKLINYKINEDNISSTYDILINNLTNIHFKLNVIGKHYGENACLAIACAIHLNIPISVIEDTLNKFSLYIGRGKIHNIKNITIYDYSYNMIHKACMKNLEEFKNINIDNKIIIIGKYVAEINNDIYFEEIINKSLLITDNVIIFHKNKNILELINNKIKILDNIELYNYILNLNKDKHWYIFIQTPNYLNTKDIILKI